MNNKRQIINFRQNFSPMQGVFILVKRGELIYNFQGNRVLNTQYHTLQIAEPVIDMEMNNKKFNILMFKISFANSLSPCDNILKLNSLFFSRVTSTRYPGNELNK